MDTLSGSISTLSFSSFHLTPRDFSHFKSPVTSHQSCSSRPNSISTTFPHHNLTASAHSFPSSHVVSTLHSSPHHTHKKPATGYAAALIDIAQSNTCLQVIQEDVKKLLNNEQVQAVLVDQVVGDKEKGKLVKMVGKKYKFNRYLVGLTKMLIERKKTEMIVEVLQEFDRISGEMTIGTKLVLGSSANNMSGEDNVFGITHKVAFNFV
ncbi:ATP synthase delta chain, chloroplastic [Carica papaya]|uniref:ATP synthase delta chain, chloroplastic n=1 Tax=Carica papaya TaxID=3649 RepID=UPI000B8CC9AA|nr:ATP synthase delta chain, chloroplastic [Carica papaya]